MSGSGWRFDILHVSKRHPFSILEAKSQSHFPATPLVKTQATTSTAAHLQWLGSRELLLGNVKACLKFPSYERRGFDDTQTLFQHPFPKRHRGFPSHFGIPENGRRHNETRANRSGPRLPLLATRLPSPGSAGPGTGSARRRSRCAAPSGGHPT